VAIFLEQTLEDATEPVVILDYEEMHDLAPLDLATDRGLMIGADRAAARVGFTALLELDSGRRSGRRRDRIRRRL
jgi:hypothetical protein